MKVFLDEVADWSSAYNPLMTFYLDFTRRNFFSKVMIHHLNNSNLLVDRENDSDT